MTKLLCSLLFITEKNLFKIHPSLEVFPLHITEVRFSLFFPRRMHRPLSEVFSQLEIQKFMFSEQPISVPLFLQDYIPPSISLTAPYLHFPLERGDSSLLNGTASLSAGTVDSPSTSCRQAHRPSSHPSRLVWPAEPFFTEFLIQKSKCFPKSPSLLPSCGKMAWGIFFS